MGIPYAEVIGDPVAHSKSPAIHQFWLNKKAFRAEYRATRVSADELAGFIDARRGDPDWRGCNLTMPHKQSILPLLDSVSSVAGQIGAANVVYRDAEGRLHGCNTDVHGVRHCLAGTEVMNRKALIVGAGGAARAAAFALAREAAEVDVMNRSVDKARQLLLDFRLRGRAMPLGKFPEVDILVNASALGMHGKAWPVLDLDDLPLGATVLDMVYFPLRTALLEAARRRRLTSVGGIDMLIGQAAEAFSLFFGEARPSGADAELREALAG